MSNAAVDRVMRSCLVVLIGISVFVVTWWALGFVFEASAHAQSASSAPDGSVDMSKMVDVVVKAVVGAALGWIAARFASWSTHHQEVSAVAKDLHVTELENSAIDHAIAYADEQVHKSKDVGMVVNKLEEAQKYLRDTEGWSVDDVKGAVQKIEARVNMKRATDALAKNAAAFGKALPELEREVASFPTKPGTSGPQPAPLPPIPPTPKP